jgi:Na+-transporting methylmalonyl-CoA/oxaloacetate decarboxylase gamma subunit
MDWVVSILVMVIYVMGLSFKECVNSFVDLEVHKNKYTKLVKLS